MATISSHTLNGADGTHAGGIPVVLVNLASRSVLFDTTMDDAGRLSEAVNLAGMNPNDRYELTFKTASYWAAKSIKHSQLVEEIVLRFKMPDANARYHMPVIISPNSYSTWVSIPQ